LERRAYKKKIIVGEKAMTGVAETLVIDRKRNEPTRARGETDAVKK